MKINNMNHQLKTVLILSLFMTATGCFKDEIPLELNKGSNVRLVVDAWLTDLDIPQIIRLQRTTGYLENVPAPNVSDAEVVVRYADAVVNFAFVGDGTYAAPPDWRLQTGTQYHLEVTHDGTTYRASGLLSDKPEVSNVRLEKSPDEDLVAE
ncbi:MAG: DUF4249 domain-containing protein, partial [Saprospiraceae bacterium]|nr:DUF4249 domain-containing protein [Saprospiraceae bacterium]